jgi:hypothetical protein
VILDPNSGALASPWCLYGVWAFLTHRARALTGLWAASGGKPADAAAAAAGSAAPAISASALAAAMDGVVVAAAGEGLDMLLVTHLWGKLGLLQASTMPRLLHAAHSHGTPPRSHTLMPPARLCFLARQGSPDTRNALHAAILKEVSAEQPLPPLGTALAAGSNPRRSTHAGGPGGVEGRSKRSLPGCEPEEAEPDTGARVAAADAALRAALQAGAERRARQLTAAAGSKVRAAQQGWLAASRLSRALEALGVWWRG